MKLYAQYGFGDGEKTLEGLKQKLIDGVIFSPKDMALEQLRTKLADIRRECRRADLLFDSQFYACIAAIDPMSNIGKLADEYDSYFAPRRRSQLLSEKQLLGDMQKALAFQVGLGVSSIIAPNIVIPRSFDSAEAAIAMDFIRNTRSQFGKTGDTRKVYATLAVSRDAVIDKEELNRFLTDLTMLDERPDGFYVLMAVNSTEARSELCHADVVAGWMLINHVLSLNGYEVINAYSDTFTPFLGAAGGAAGATGWWSNLRSFSLDRFGVPMRGGRLPVERYLSCALLNRLTYYELEAVRDVLPQALNGLPTDGLYPKESGSQPPRNREVLQSWDALRALNRHLVRDNIVTSLTACRQAVVDASLLYDDIQLRTTLDPKSDSRHLEPLVEGMRLFAGLAEIEFA